MKRFFVRTVAVKPRLNTIKLFSFGNIYIYCDFNYKTLKKKKKKNKKAEKLDVFRVSISLFLKRVTERSFRISIADKARMNTIKRKLVSVVQKNKNIATKRKVIEVGSFPETLEQILLVFARRNTNK